MNNLKGHRKRLREKFLSSGLSGFNEYEIVELLLTIGTPRTDCKQQAKEALKEFKSLRGVLSAPVEELQKIKGIGKKNIFGLKFMQEVAKKFLQGKILNKLYMKSSKEVFDYLYYSMRDLKKEVFKVIFLNNENAIIEIENLFEGTINQSIVYTREIIKKATQNNAIGLIFVHNHPSGNPKPSKNDEDITIELVKACKIMQIKVLDHIIIGDNKYFSFADEGMMKKYYDNISKKE